ncbi:hypothetical protein LTR56_010428 [Elasticomyces elasticus]|nr:hypothetical protein LTR56_010428 [Elasticomyces elasticus]
MAKATEMCTKQDLLRLLAFDQDAHLDFLQSLVRTPSSNPPGDTRDAVKLVEQYLRKYGIGSRIIAPHTEAPNLVSVADGDSKHHSSRRLVLNGHIDCFPVIDADQWQRNPYSGEIQNGFVHGRGVVDMKAGTAASIIAYTYIHRFRSQLAGQCVLEIVSDEETGEPGGLGSIRFGEKGTLRMTFTVTTQSGHGAYVHRDEGAIRIAARMIDRLVGLESLVSETQDVDLARYLRRQDVRTVADNIMGEGAADSMLRPTVNVGTISGGAKVNMIPSSCSVEVDIRLPISLKAETVLSRIDELLCDIPEASYKVQAAASNPAARSPIEHELVDLIQRNAETIGRSKPLPIVSLGATDCKHFRYHGVPAYSYGPNPDTQAARDEKVSVEDFLQTIKVHTLTAWDYLGGAA